MSVLYLEDLNEAKYLSLRVYINSEAQSHFCFIRYLFRFIKNIACQIIFLGSALSLQLIKKNLNGI